MSKYSYVAATVVVCAILCAPVPLLAQVTLGGSLNVALPRISRRVRFRIPGT